MNRPVPPQLSLPGYISWLPALVVFLAKTLGYQQTAEAYMDWADARVAELEATAPPVPLDDRPDVLLHPKDAAWMETIWNQIKATTQTKIERYTLDGAYWALNRADFEKVLAYSWKEKKMWVGEQYDCPIPTELAWTFGLFHTDGTCGMGTEDNRFWDICNTDVSKLERAKVALNSEFQDFEFTIRQYPSEAKGQATNFGLRTKALYRLRPKLKVRHNDGIYSRFLLEFHKMFYSLEAKKTPAVIYENTLAVKQAYMEGVLAGDGTKGKSIVTVHGAAAVSGLTKLANDIGWRPGIRMESRRNQTYYLHMNRRHRYDALVAEHLETTQKELTALDITRELGIDDYSRIRESLIRLETKGYVKSSRSWRRRAFWSLKPWDKNGCDDFALVLKAHFAEDWYPSGCNTVGFLVDNSSHHAYNLVIFEDGSWAIIEPGGDGDPNTGITWVDVTEKLGQAPYEFREGYLLL